MKTLCVFLGLLFFANIAQSYPTTGPVIGIVTNPADGFDQYPEDKFSYFYASYVKYLEQGGAQVVPIYYDLPHDKIGSLLDKLNGVLFTGGSNEFEDKPGKLSEFGATLDYIVNYVIQQNQKGKYYPLWGTCMGFQAIAGLIAKDFSILTGDCEGCHGVNKNNYWSNEYKSKLYSGLSEDLKQKMTNANLSVFYHQYMYHYDTFENTYPLNITLTPVTHSYDTRGVKYVSSYESPSMPIYGTQFHPEKNAFEWRASYAMNRGYDAILLQQYYANFFVNEARKNTNTFPDKDHYIIENYTPVVLPNHTVTSIYFFPSLKIKEAAPLNEKVKELHGQFRKTIYRI